MHCLCLKRETIHILFVTAFEKVRRVEEIFVGEFCAKKREEERQDQVQKCKVIREGREGAFKFRRGKKEKGKNRRIRRKVR